MNSESTLSLASACKILKIGDINVLTQPILRRNYLTQSIMTHPDKLTPKQQAELVYSFTDVVAAYELLQAFLVEYDLDRAAADESHPLGQFINNIAPTDMSKWPEYLRTSHATIIDDICNHMKTYIDSTDPTIPAKFNIHRATEDAIGCIMKSLFPIQPMVVQEMPEYSIITTSLDEMYNGMLREINIGEDGGEIFKLHIPLWQDIIMVDECDPKLLVFIVPQLPDAVILDSTNTIHLHVKMTISDIFDNDVIQISLPETMIVFTLSASEFIMKSKQTIVLHEQGMPIRKGSAGYTFTNRGNVNIHVEIVDHHPPSKRIPL
jgi:hypothetical protein